MEASTGVIEVTRLPTRWRDRGLRYTVLLDGEQRAELRPGESARLELALEPGAVVSLVCETGGSARTGLREEASKGFVGWIALRFAD
jgi:hypothetical protein